MHKAFRKNPRTVSQILRAYIAGSGRTPETTPARATLGNWNVEAALQIRDYTLTLSGIPRLINQSSGVLKRRLSVRPPETNAPHRGQMLPRNVGCAVHDYCELPRSLERRS